MRRFIPFMTNNNVISNEFPEPVEGNEVKNLLAFSRINFLLINLLLEILLNHLPQRQERGEEPDNIS
jgi:hypothetical protein